MSSVVIDDIPVHSHTKPPHKPAIKERTEKPPKQPRLEESDDENDSNDEYNVETLSDDGI